MIFERRIGGIEKMSMLDYPNRLSAILFYNGCNLRCPYCYNPSLVCLDNQEEAECLDRKEIIDFLTLRRGVLDGIVFSGGECTLWGEKLIEDLDYTKNLGYLVKVDHNGQRPEFLKRIIGLKLADYVALDIKCPKRLSHLFKCDMGKTYRALEYLIESGIKYETRTTIHPDITNEEDISELLSELRSVTQSDTHYIQYFFDCPATVGNVKQPPRYFNLNKVDKHGFNIIERNGEMNRKRKQYDLKKKEQA